MTCEEEQTAAINFVRGRIKNPTRWESFTTRAQVQVCPEIFYNEIVDLSTIFDFTKQAYPSILNAYPSIIHSGRSNALWSDDLVPIFTTPNKEDITSQYGILHIAPYATVAFPLKKQLPTLLYLLGNDVMSKEKRVLDDLSSDGYSYIPSISIKIAATAFLLGHTRPDKWPGKRDKPVYQTIVYSERFRGSGGWPDHTLRELSDHANDDDFVQGIPEDKVGELRDTLGYLQEIMRRGDPVPLVYKSVHKASFPYHQEREMGLIQALRLSLSGLRSQARAEKQEPAEPVAA